MSNTTDLQKNTVSRRAFLRGGSLCMVGMAGMPALAAAVSQNETPATAAQPLVKVGLVTDCHFADQQTTINRFYRESLAKLETATGAFRDAGVHFILQNGDFIDGESRAQEYLTKMYGVLEASKIPSHHVLGNHDVQLIEKAQFLDTVGKKNSYYSFEQGGVHFIVLDGCFRRDFVAYAPGNYDWKDTTIPPEQLKWLEEDLAATKKPTIVFVHQRLDVPAGNINGIASSAQVRKIFEDSGKVLAVIQGHTHVNEYNSIKGIHYCTLQALVEGSGKAHNAYAILNVFANGDLQLEGFGTQKSRQVKA